MSKTTFYLGHLNLMLWVAPFFFGAIGAFNSRDAGVPQRVALTAWVMVFVLARLWVRVRSDVRVRQGSVVVDTDGIARSHDLSEILAVVPADHIGADRLALIILRPIWRSPLLTAIPERAIRQLVESDVRVIGWSRGRLAEQDRGDAFFSSEG